MKGKLKSKVLVLLGKPIVSGLVKSIPFGIGSLAANLLDNLNGTKAGQIDKRTISPIIIKIVIYAAIGLAISKGWLSIEHAEIIKGQIAPF